MIYFDNSATSPIDEEVVDVMLPYLREEYGNPSSKYYAKAANAKKAVEDWYLLKQKLIITNMKIFQVWLERFRKLCLVLT